MEELKETNEQINRLPWEMDEILIFISSFDDKLCTISGTKKKAKLNEISEKLRTRGVQLGYDCYPTYRNFHSIENMFYAAKSYLLHKKTDGLHPMLKEGLDLYLENREEYEKKVSAIPSIQIEKKTKTKAPVQSQTRKVGNCGATFKLKDVSKQKKDILKQLKKNYSQVSDFKLEKAEEHSWASSLETIVDAYKQLDPASFGELDVVMEYVMPRYKPGSTKADEEHSIRADAVIVSSKTVLVLEFKQRDTGFEEGFVKQAGKYQTRLNRYHKEAENMIIKSVLVLTKADNHIKSFGTVASCSADKLADAIALMFEPSPQPNKEIEEWIHSGFNA